MYLCACDAQKRGSGSGKGGSDQLHAAMRLHDERLLRDLGLPADLLALAENEAAAAAVRVMNARPDHADVALFGCAALSMLAQRSEGGCVAVRDAGGAAAVIRALELFAREPRIQEYGCSVIGSVAEQGAAGKRAVVAAVPALVRAVREQPVDVQSAAISALWSVAAGALSVKAAIVKAGGAAGVVDVMAQHPGSVELQEVGLGALSSLTYNGSHAALLARDGGARRVAEAALAAHSGPRVQALGSKLLKALQDAVEGSERTLQHRS